MDQIRYVLKHQPKPNFTLQTVIKAISRAVDAEDILVDCTCPDFCLHEDTEIKLLNNEVVTVKDLFNKFQNNEELWVYSTDEHGDFKPGQVTDVWISGHVSKMIKVTLDNGKSIITTPNHRYMLRDGSYLEAENLEVGQSLMPLYFSYHNGYESVKLNSKSHSFVSVYKTVANELLQNEITEAKLRSDEDIIAIHHKDYNKLNNYPSNLKPLGFQEHWKFHADHAKENPRFQEFINAGHDYWKTEEGRFRKSQEMSESIKKFWNEMTESERLEYIKSSHAWMYTEEGHKKLSEGLKNYWNNLSEEDFKKRSEINSISLNGINGEKSSERKKNWWKNASEEQLQKMKEVQSANGKKVNANITEKMRNARSNNCKAAARQKLINKGTQIINEIIADGLIVCEETFSKYRKSGDPKFNTIKELGLLDSYNHKIISIEVIDYDEPIPVYDLTVDKYNNFYVNAGVILHNCYRFAYWATKYGYKWGEPENRPAKITNPKDKLGAMCKHLTSLLSNKKWLVKVASIINEFAKAYPDDFIDYLDMDDLDVEIKTPGKRRRSKPLKSTPVVPKEDPEELEPIDSEDELEVADAEDGYDETEVEINDEEENDE